jgi:hypothetical protein
VIGDVGSVGLSTLPGLKAQLIVCLRQGSVVFVFTLSRGSLFMLSTEMPQGQP